MSTIYYSLESVTIVNRSCNRWTNKVKVQRLLGTQVSLIGATTNTTCGTINSVNPDRSSVEAQTYTILCPTTKELTLAVFLYDDVIEESYDKKKGKNWIIMNLAEVMVFATPISK